LKITYEKDTMIIEHPSGHVDKYGKAYLEALERDAQAFFEIANDQLIAIKTHIVNIKLQE